MDLLKNLLSENSAALISGLVEKVGFDQDQAERFVPEAAQSAFDTFKDKADDLDLDNLQGTAQNLMENMDLGALASKVGISSEQAGSGLTEMLPNLLSLLNDKAGALGGLSALTGLLKGGGIGDMLGGAGGLGKLFGK